MLKRVLYLIFIVTLTLSCENKENYSVKEEYKEFYIETGSKLASDAFVNLSSNLKKAITNGGFAGAVSFCNLKVNEIMKNLQKSDGIEISRVSDKNRNPDNNVNEEELLIIDEYKQDLKDKLKTFPTLRATKTDIIFYSPIKILPLCLNCHGDASTQINQETKNKIDQLYPEDKAINYKLDDLRGLWKIVFKNQKENIKLKK